MELLAGRGNSCAGASSVVWGRGARFIAVLSLVLSPPRWPSVEYARPQFKPLPSHTLDCKEVLSRNPARRLALLRTRTVWPGVSIL